MGRQIRNKEVMEREISKWAAVCPGISSDYSVKNPTYNLALIYNAFGDGSNRIIKRDH
ncbi:MAG: hypothetical protein O6939_09315 [Bacteroidetes bacterium]|nr:hypothetical protein [Bacteroidota bacterium]